MNVLLINSGQAYAQAEGKLNSTLHDVAKKYFLASGFNTKETLISAGYDIDEEIEKFLWADFIIYQMPAWWMSMPWETKKYIDEVYTFGYGKLYQNDGRTDENPNGQYGTGGLLQGKKYMLSVTWNAPEQAFNGADNFFEQSGVDGIYFAFHKAQQFLGLSSLPTFMVNDVVKKPNVEQYIANYKKHLAQIFGK